MLNARQTDIATTLAPVRRTLGLARIRQSSRRGLLAGAMVGSAVLAGGYVSHTPWVHQAGVIIAVSGVVIGFLLGALAWPDAGEAARAADRHFAFQDRLTSALEFRNSHEPIAILQRSDMARRVRSLPMGRVRAQRLALSEAALLLAIIAAFASLWLAGRSFSAGARSTATLTTQQRIHQAAIVNLSALLQRLDQDTAAQNGPASSLRQAQTSVAHLRQQLLRTSGLGSALRSISLTQDEIQRLTRALHPLNSAAVSQLSASLRGALGGRAATHNLSAATLAKELQHLATLLQRYSPSQRQRLAQALQRAANGQSDGQLRAALRQAASWVGQNKIRSGQRAIRRAASLLSRSAAARAEQARLNSINSQLDSLKNRVAGFSGRSRGTPGANPRQRSRSGRNGSNRAGRVPGAGGATPFKASGRTYAVKPGSRRELLSDARSAPAKTVVRGNSAFQGLSGVSGHSTGEVPQSTSQSTGKFNALYIPGQQHQGLRTVSLGPKGTPQQSAPIAYRQLLARYEQSAHAALDRASLPPSLQDYVRRYFTVITH